MKNVLTQCCLLFFLCASVGWSTHLRGRVTDPSGAAVPKARVTVVNDASGLSQTALSDPTGSFAIDNLAAGSYTVSVEFEGFETAKQTVRIEGDGTIEVAVRLTIQQQEAEIEVSSKRSSLANADPNYRGLRAGRIAATFAVENLVLIRDVGKITLRSGQVSFLAPVLGRTAVAVFSGSGTFELTPLFPMEQDYLELMTSQRAVKEEFESLVLSFTDATEADIRANGKAVENAGKNADILGNFQKQTRRRTETPRSLVEAFLAGDEVPNLDAELLSELYNPAARPSFSAYIRGKKHSHLRFLIKMRGAVRSLSPEEVGLINLDPDGQQDGIWYLSHLTSEWRLQKASAKEDKRIIATENYKIDTVLGKRDRLAAIAEIRFKALRDGDRIIDFDLLPNLRVARVTIANKEIGFIQESRKQDGSFYVVLPDATRAGQAYTISVEYDGDKVVRNQGEGNFAVMARTSWYPNAGAFREQSTFDLTFRTPKQYTLVSVGKLVKQWREEGFAVTRWVSEQPLAVAGFNYGEFKKKERRDEPTQYDLETYATAEVPSYLRNLGPFTMSPSSMAESALVDSQNAMRVFTAWFGPLPYGRLAITQQPQFFFGQSWPSLVYLPVSAFLDSTQRWALLGGSAFKFSEFIQEVTPHEVSHQWWGHAVGWASYHDQWLSEGFADFSAGLVLNVIETKQDKYQRYWENARKMIVEKNEFGNRANDAGPIYMGLRLNTFKTASAYRKMIYPKGGYVLHMLRYLMQDEKGDQDFIALMHDFVKTNLYKNAATEDFMAAVQRHMKPSMNLAGDGSIGWFFRQWVLDKELPSYKIQYSVAPAEGGKYAVKFTITQSEVSNDFRMRVPVYAELDGRMIKAGTVPIAGSRTTKEMTVVLPKKPKKIVVNANHDILSSADVSEEI